MKHFTSTKSPNCAPQPTNSFVDEAAKRHAAIRAELGIDELLREGERLEGKPLEDVLGGYNGRRSERRLSW